MTTPTTRLSPSGRFLDGSGGSELTPLSSAFFVDGASVASGTPNGSIGNPFKTIGAAVAAAPDKSTIFVCWTQTGYPETVDCGDKQLMFCGIQVPNDEPFGTINVTEFDAGGGGLALQNITCDVISNPAGEVDLVDANVNQTLTAFNLVATARRNGVLGGAVSCTGGVTLHNYGTSGTVDCAQFVATSDQALNDQPAISAGVVASGGFASISGMVIVANVTGFQVFIDESTINAAITIRSDSDDSNAPGMTITNTRLGDPSLVVTLAATNESIDLAIDYFTKQWLKNAVTSSFSLVRVLGALPQETETVAVPNVAAGSVAYANVNMTGELAGVATTDLVVGNPSADLVAAGAGGAYTGCRVSAPGVIRCAFVGPLSSQNVAFTFARLSRAPFP